MDSTRKRKLVTRIIRIIEFLTLSFSSEVTSPRATERLLSHLHINKRCFDTLNNINQRILIMPSISDIRMREEASIV